MDAKLYRLGWVLAAGLFLNAAGLLMPYLPVRPAHAQVASAPPSPVYLVTPAGRPLTIMEQPVKDTLGRNQVGFGLMITAPNENPLPVRVSNPHPVPVRIHATNRRQEDGPVGVPFPVAGN